MKMNKTKIYFICFCFMILFIFIGCKNPAESLFWISNGTDNSIIIKELFINDEMLMKNIELAPKNLELMNENEDKKKIVKFEIPGGKEFNLKAIIYDNGLKQEIKLIQDFNCTVNDVGCFFIITYKNGGFSWRTEERRSAFD